MVEKTSDTLSCALPCVYWIGGAPCAGKSTVAQSLADRYNLHYYQCDAHFEVHQQRATATQQPTLARLASLSCDEIWLPPVAEQLARVQAIYHEEFSMIMADLHTLPKERPLLVEGSALLPLLVLPHLSACRHAIWITPTPAFQRSHYVQRPWIHDVLRTCTDPRLAFQNWMARDEAYAAWIEEQTRMLGLPCLWVDGQQTLDQMTQHIAACLALDGPPSI